MNPHPIRRAYPSPRLLIAVLVLSGLGGCSWPDRPKPAGTLAAKDLARDTDKARRLNAHAASLLRAGNYSQAADSLAAALQADPLFAPAHNNLGKVHFHQGRFYEAADEFQQASKLMPNRPEPLSNLGLVMESVAHALGPDARPAKLDEAIAAYDRALALAPNSPALMGNLVRARLRRGLRDQRTQTLLQRLLTIDTRPDWLSWARQELAALNPPARSLKGPG